MTYKVGDRVRVISNLPRYFDNGLFVNPEMRDLQGKIGVISRVDSSAHKDGLYRIKGSKYWWCDECFEPRPTITITTDGTTVTAYMVDKETKSATARCSPSDTFDFLTGAKLALERLAALQSKYSLGDKVKVVDHETHYPTYTDWVKKHAPEYAGIFGEKSSVSDGEIGTVVCIAHHGSYEDILLLCQKADGKVFLISEDGVEPYTGLNCRVVCTVPGFVHTKGKIYDVKDGVISDDRGQPYNPNTPARTIDDLNNLCAPQFVQLI